MKTYRVAILGCRGRGTAAARAYHAHPRTEVVGLCDLVQELVDTLGDELGVDARYDDLDAMIVETKPDIVAIPTGTEFHYPLLMRVLEHGVHVEVEKPICVELHQADEVLTKASEKGVRVAVHHQSRTGGMMRAVHRAVEDGRIGKVRHLNAGGKGYYGGYGMMKHRDALAELYDEADRPLPAGICDGEDGRASHRPRGRGAVSQRDGDDCRRGDQRSLGVRRRPHGKPPVSANAGRG